MKATKKEPPFEEMLAELEAIVAQMEAGGLPLEKTMALYEKGAELEKKLGRQLESSQQRVTMLLSKDGQMQEVPFAEGEG